MMKRRALLSAAVATTAVAGLPAKAQTLLGVTAKEIKIGNTIAYSGNASAYGVIGKSHAAYFKMVNAMGGRGLTLANVPAATCCTWQLTGTSPADP